MGWRAVPAAKPLGGGKIPARLSERMNFTEFTQIALLGTERQPPPPSTDSGTPLDRLLAQLDLAQRERFVLAAAALSMQCERVGSLTSRESRPAPEPCRPEERQRTRQRAGASLLTLLDGQDTCLL